MSTKQDRTPPSGKPSSPMQALAAVFAKAAEQESGPEKAYLRKVAVKALKSTGD